MSHNLATIDCKIINEMIALCNLHYELGKLELTPKDEYIHEVIDRYTSLQEQIKIHRTSVFALLSKLRQQNLLAEATQKMF